MIILGAGGHARSLLDIIKGLTRFEVVGFIDPALELGSTRYNIPVVGSEDRLSESSSPATPSR